MPATLKLNPAVLAACDDLALLARTLVEGFMDGLHRSPFLGYSTEFSTYRSYTPGDDLRYLDWKVWGRSDKYYVKQFEDDTNLACQIFLDTSASMDFGAGEANKFDYGRILAAVLAYLMSSQHDAPGLILFGPRAQQAVPVQSTRHHADEIFQALTRLRSEGLTLIGNELFSILESLRRRGLAVVISDFLVSGEIGLKVLEQLRGQNQEVLLFHILSPEELDLPFQGEWLVQDSETGEEIPIHMDSWRPEYQKKLDEFCGRLRAQCVRLEIDYVPLRTDTPLDSALISYLERRATL